MADVVLAKLDGEERDYHLAPPLGILYLADALEKAGFSVRLVSQFVNKRSFRAQTARSVIEEIEDYKQRYGIRAVIFEDDGFFTRRDRALEIVRHIGIPWTASRR